MWTLAVVVASIALIVVIAALLVLCTCIVVVPPQHRAVSQNAVSGIYAELGPGLRVLSWPVEQLVCVQLPDKPATMIPTGVQRWDPPPWQFQTKDRQTVDVDPVVHYKIVDAVKLVQSGTVVGQVLYDEAQAQLATAVHDLNADAVRTSSLQHTITPTASARMLEAGLQITGYHVESVKFSPGYTQARDAGARARVEEDTTTHAAAMQRERETAAAKHRHALESAEASHMGAMQILALRREQAALTAPLEALTRSGMTQEAAAHFLLETKRYEALGKVQKLRLTTS